ncbi:exported hypothetical protein [Candidatus Nitrospira nitrosa]|uniref:Lipoprotein n=1 Tax=Candidatus Nitrospira nitrosa TaxID=1742972 RepID=A0A0S4LIP3_9BACT|nr:hypothetical protein [Candidatus Nitrospira nitrosa]CUS37443.1 exported hypothetical protein [Candidatus Nitrospira nitrosa]
MRQALILIVCCALATGCIATHRSNTAWLDEKVHVGLLEVPPFSDALYEEFPDFAFSTAASLAVKAAGAALKWEASKYVQDSTGRLEEASLGKRIRREGPEGYVLLNEVGGPIIPVAYITVLRYITPKRDSGILESMWRTLLWFERPTQLESLNHDFIEDVVRRVRGYNAGAMYQRKWETIQSAFGLDKIPENSFVGFVAVLQITAAPPMIGKKDGYSNYRIELLDYRYSSLKSKNLSWIRVPFTNWEETKSVLTVSLQGPKADMRLIGNQYEGKADFEVQWNRKLSSDNKPSEWVNKDERALGKSLARSTPIHTYDFRNFGVSIKLSEAGSLKEGFESASTKIIETDLKKLLKQ